MSCSCGSRGASFPHPVQGGMMSSHMCQCNPKIEVCGACWNRYPVHRKDGNGVEIDCPRCGKFLAYFQWSRMSGPDVIG